MGGGAELSEGTPPDVPRLCPITLMGNLDLNGRNLQRFVDLRNYTCALFFLFFCSELSRPPLKCCIRNLCATTQVLRVRLHLPLHLHRRPSTPGRKEPITGALPAVQLLWEPQTMRSVTVLEGDSLRQRCSPHPPLLRGLRDQVEAA